MTLKDKITEKDAKKFINKKSQTHFISAHSVL